jgi:hypothetical protein
MDSDIIPFVQRSLEINNMLIDVLNDKLGLPKGMLATKHAQHLHSQSQARAIKAPRNQHLDNVKISLGAHTDFGSLVRHKPCTCEKMALIIISTVLSTPQDNRGSPSSAPWQ